MVDSAGPSDADDILICAIEIEFNGLRCTTAVAAYGFVRVHPFVERIREGLGHCPGRGVDQEVLPDRIKQRLGPIDRIAVEVKEPKGSFFLDGFTHLTDPPLVLRLCTGRRILSARQIPSENFRIRETDIRPVGGPTSMAVVQTLPSVPGQPIRCGRQSSCKGSVQIRKCGCIADQMRASTGRAGAVEVCSIDRCNETKACNSRKKFDTPPPHVPASLASSSPSETLPYCNRYGKYVTLAASRPSVSRHWRRSSRQRLRSACRSAWRRSVAG